MKTARGVFARIFEGESMNDDMRGGFPYMLKAASGAEMPLGFLEGRGLSGAGASSYGNFSGYWKMGEVGADSAFSLFDESGREYPVQSHPAAFWPDGSLKWTFHTADFRPEERAAFSPVVEYGRKPAPLVGSVVCNDAGDRLVIDTGAIQAEVFTSKTRSGAFLGKTVILGRTAISEARLVYIDETPSCDGDVFPGIASAPARSAFFGAVSGAKIEEIGRLQAVIRIEGIHVEEKTGRELMPFVVRLTFRLGEPFIRIEHTFTYTGEPSRDMMRGLGIEFLTPVSGREYNRHVVFSGDLVGGEGCRAAAPFHEAQKMLLSWHPKLDPDVYPSQIAGKPLLFNPAESSSRAVDKVVSSIPAWTSYRMLADSADHWRITKGTGKDGCSRISAAEGRRSAGAASLSGEDGGIVVCMKDFWQKYPSGIWFDAIGSGDTSGDGCPRTTVWFWSPDAGAKDFRHYDTEGHSGSYYEGYDKLGSDPFGISCTNEMVIGAFLPHDGRIALSGEEIDAVAHDAQKSALLVSTPEYYHGTQAFGIWSLPDSGTPDKARLEKQLDDALSFYKKEIEQRRWYGFFDYGDFMHTYDKDRHCWRYDMGGYAWQNTELVPTMWLWYSFLRTGREDVFTMAEAMSRHTSEVDIYHEGKFRGMGSRHNVIHWGCPCKEVRIAMAGHHRFAFYLGGDRRYSDIFDIVRDADFSTLETDPLAMFYDKAKMKLPTHARSGPDWSTYTSNWLTEWERHRSEKYGQKIRTGIEDLKAAPLKLVSGNNFEYDPESGHLGYIGESTAGGTHLAVCMGGPQTWFELVPLLGDDEWERMLADFGSFYFASKEEQQERSGGIIGNREFSLPFMAAAMGAFGANRLGDKKLARKVWDTLLASLKGNGSSAECGSEFVPEKVPFCSDGRGIDEVPWVTTNVTAQFCLNAIVCLELIGRDL